MKVAFWSPLHGRGTTASCAAISTYIALNYNGRCLLADTQFCTSSLERAFFSEKQAEDLHKYEYGIDSLDRLFIANQIIDEKEFKSYVNEIIKNRLDIVVSSEKKNSKIFQQCFEKTIPKILDNADSYYDMVLTDINSGDKNSITQKIIDNSDVIIVVLEQNQKMLIDFFKNNYHKIRNKHIILVMGRYNRKSKYTKDFIKQAFGYKEHIFSIPYSTNFMDAINDHGVKKFFYSNNESAQSDENEYFFLEVSGIGDKLCSISHNEIIEKSPMLSDNLYLKIKRRLRGVEGV